MEPDIDPAANIATITCMLYWDAKLQCITKLPAVPQIGTTIMLDYDQESVYVYRVAGVSFTAPYLSPEDFEKNYGATFTTFVKVMLIPEDVPIYSNEDGRYN